MRHSTFTSVTPVILATLALVHCGAASDHKEDIDRNEQALYSSDTSLIFPWNQPNDARVIPVCWIDDGVQYSNTPGYKFYSDMAKQRQWAKDAANDAWGRYAGITFSGWNKCPSTATKGWRIKILSRLNPITDKEKSGTSYFSFDGTVDTVAHTKISGVLDLETGSTLGLQEKEKVQRLALHEFGHGLGFKHEWDRKAEYDDMLVSGQSVNGKTAIGPYDVASVLNYSYSYGVTWPDTGNPKPDYPYLSDVDKLGIAHFYGRKPARAIVGYGGNCLDAVGGDIVKDVGIQVFGCHGKGNQQWQLDSSGALRVSGETSVYPIATSSVAGASVKLGQSATNYFRMAEFQIVGQGGKCLTAIGSNLRLKPCGADKGQQWSRISNRLKNVATGTCVIKTADSPYYSMGTCATAPVANFVDGGILRIGTDTSQCADVVGGYKALLDDNVIQPYPCKKDGSSEYLNQRFHKRGSLRLQGDSSKCLGIKVETTSPGTPVTVQACSGALTQAWDAHW